VNVRLRDVLLAMFVGGAMGWAWAELATPDETVTEEPIDLSATT
jgi:hypothetical protein